VDALAHLRSAGGFAGAHVVAGTRFRELAAALGTASQS
jgi:hypothetical protein